MRSVLELVTAPNATLPADGAILVTRSEAPARENERDEQWKLQDGNGHDVPFRAELLGGSAERWVPTTTADRDLVIVGTAGKKIATVHQTKTKSPALAAPKAVSLTSTTSLADAHAMRMGVPGSAVALVLASDPPADARFLTIAITGDAPRVHSVFEAKPNQRKFEITTYAHKSCASGGPEPLFAGEHVALTWVDSLGRRSAATQITATKQH